MSRKYKLVDRKPVEVHDLMEWAEVFESSERVVKQENVGDTSISTMFLGIDHNWSGGKPILFETMIFGGPLDMYQERCHTWEQAEEMHKVAVLAHQEAVKGRRIKDDD